MQNLPKELSSHATIRFQDCDPFNHLNNAKYLDYFMNAREDQVLEAYNLNIYEIGITQDIGWVVAQNQIAYVQPAMLMEKVIITSKIVKFGPRSMTVEFQMRNSKSNALKAMMWSSFAHIDIRKGVSIKHNAEFMEMFSQVLMSHEGENFEQRQFKLRAEEKANKLK